MPLAKRSVSIITDFVNHAVRWSGSYFVDSNMKVTSFHRSLSKATDNAKLGHNSQL